MASTRPITRFLSLSAGDKFRVFLASSLLVAVPVAVVPVPFSAVRRVLVRLSTVGDRLVPGDPSPDRTVWAVEAADRTLPGSRSCLVRSLTSETLLRLYGYVPVHRIGVDPNAEEGFVAHSWLEYEGEILIGDLDDLSRYDTLPPLDDEGGS